MLKRILGASFVLQLLLIALVNAQTTTEPLYKLDDRQTRVLELSNLYNDADCHPARLNGLVIRRQFDQSDVVMTGVVIEERDGRRSLFNIGVDLKSMSMVTKEWVLIGLQTLLKEGNRVALGVRQCGAAGRVVFVDSVRLTR